MGSMGAEPGCDYDVLIIGSGLSGICSLYHIRQRFPSWRVRVLEAATGPGGTWHWNRYPGARFDSESVSYGFSFDKELLDEWHWKEAFSAQPDTLKYIERVCEKHDLYKDIQFNTRIASASWLESNDTWIFTDEAGAEYKTRFFISCIGFLSAPTLPDVPGIASFQGESFHSSRWPQNFDMARDFANKRIGVVGTGATGIQIITALSKEPSIKSIDVFQRTANWSAPLHNTEITPERMEEIKKEYPSIFQRCLETSSCFLHTADPRKTFEVTDEERLAHFQKVYSEPGMAKWLGSFSDTYTSRAANKAYSDFHAEKIRARINDPVVADGLIPKNHGFGTRRVPLESGYFEAYNKSNVRLVDLQKTPIQSVRPKGILTTDGNMHEVDVLIFATGFNAVTGAFNAIDWHAKDDRPLLGSNDQITKTGKRPIWMDHRPTTYLGITVHSMPNMFMVLGPHQPFGNATRSIEHAVEVVCELLQHVKDNGYSYVEPTQQAVDGWTEHVMSCSEGALMNEVDSWMTGVNKNVSGKTVRHVARYAGSAIEYRRRCEESRAKGWAGLVFA